MDQVVQELVQQALAVAKSVVTANIKLHQSISRQLEKEERMEGQALQDLIQQAEVPEDLRKFVLERSVAQSALDIVQLSTDSVPAELPGNWAGNLQNGVSKWYDRKRRM